MKDILEVDLSIGHTLFMRSAKAWETHSQNYYAAESMVTEVGRILFNKTLDFTWCHLTLTAQQLKDSLPFLTAHDLVITAQIILSYKDIIHTKVVDWLAWEDPFILNKKSEEYKKEKEQDIEETKKRLNYVLPIIELLFKEYKNSAFIKRT